MGLFKRVNTVIVAQLNEIVDTFERPEQMLKQAVREMEAALHSATESTARAIAGEKRLRQQQSNCQAKAKLWHNRAAEFLKRGDETAARRALSRQLEQQRLSEALAGPISESEATTARLSSQLDAMRSRLAEARRHLTSLVARQRCAEAKQDFARALVHFETDVEAFDRFDQWSQHVAEAEAIGDAITELRSAPVDEVPFDRSIDDEFRSLKCDLENGAN